MCKGKTLEHIKKFRKILLRVLLSVIGLMLLITLILSLPGVQTSLAKWATNKLNTTFNTNITIDRLSASLFTGNMHLKGVYIEDYKKDTLIYIDKLTTSLVSVKNAVDGKLNFGKIKIKKLKLNIKTYQGETDTNLDVFIAKLDDGKPASGDPFLLTATSVLIDDGIFKLYDQNLNEPQILNFTKLNTEVTDFKILGPDVTTQIERLSFLHQNGLPVNNLSAQFAYSKKNMIFNNLFIVTPESNLKGDLIFSYNREDFKDFVNKVHLTGNFKESVLSFNEINKFYNEFGATKKVAFSAKIDGVLNNFTATNLDLTSENTQIKGDFIFKNIFKDADNFSMQADINYLSSNYYQLKELLPNILGNTLPTSFEKFGQFSISGTTLVTTHNIKAKLNLFTDLGTCFSDLSLTNIDNIDNATYVGYVSMQDFNIGAFINDENLTYASFDFEVDGKGFTQKTLNTEVVGKVYSLVWRGYDYNNIEVSGVLKDQLFDGNLVVDDSNFKMNFKGLADLSQENNKFNFIAQVDYANLKAMNIIKKDSVAVFKGNVQMDIVGNSIDNTAGTITFKQTNYTNPNDSYYFNDFNVVSTFKEDGSREIVINSPDIVTGTIKGKFSYKEIGKLVQNSVGSIYTNYSPHKLSKGQYLDFNLKIYNKIIEVFYPELELGKNTAIRGSMNADSGDFKLNFKSPNIQWEGNKFEVVDVKIDNKNPIFNTYVAVNTIDTDYYKVSDFNLINTSLKDTLFFRTEFKGGNNLEDVYNLNFYHTFNENNRSVVGLKKSDVTFKGFKWYLNKNNDSKNKVVFNKTLDSIKIERLVLSHNNEQIDLKGELVGKEYKNIELLFNSVSLNKITPAIEGLALEGLINGKFSLLQQEENYLPAGNLSIQNLEVNQAVMGNFNMGIVGNQTLSSYVVNAQLENNNKINLSAIGTIEYQAEESNSNLLLSFNEFNIAPFSLLGEDAISNIRGFASGNVNVSGPLGSPKMKGSLNLFEAGLKIPYLNTDYNFLSPANVNLYDQTFEFNNIVLSDVAHKTNATVNGTISHTDFSDWFLNLSIDTNNNRFLVLNTTASEDKLYYGTGFMNGTAEIFGATDALTITVNASTSEGTSLKIPVSDVTAIGDYSFINFINKNEQPEVQQERVLQDYPGLELYFDLDVQPNAEVEIVIDQQSGSSLKGTGAGNLLIEINTKGKFNMYGDFITFTGEYNFKYGGVIDKKFKVRPGGTINWEGDPLGARVNMQAVYSLTANPAILLENQNYTRRIPVDVVISLQEELMQPELDFSIEFPGTSSILVSEMQYQLEDPDQRERQAFSLLYQGTFANQSIVNQQIVAGNVVETASSMVNQMLSTNNSKFNVGFNYELGYRDIRSDIQTQDRVGVTFSTQLNDKIVINGQVGVPVGVTETVVAGDVEMLIRLNDDGTLNARIFNKENEIQQFLADRQGYTQGVGLSYQVDFNTFQELLDKIFISKKKREEKIKFQEKQDSLTKSQEPDVVKTIGNNLIKIKSKKGNQKDN